MKKYDDLISVIVPIYNVEEYLDKCIDSVSKQSYRKLEIILVDDGSIDGCPKKCDNWSKKDNRIKVIHKKNGGLSDARNVGIANANGKYLYFIDSDDYIDKDMIENLYKTLKQNNSEICASGFIYEKEEFQQPCYCNEDYVENSEQVLKRLITDDDLNPGICDKLYAKTLFEQIKFPVGKICEDMGTLYKLISKAKKISHIAKAQYHYVQRDGSIINSKFSAKNLDDLFFREEIYLFIKKEYPSLAQEAEYFYIKQLNKSIVLCYHHNLREEYKSLKQKLKKNLFSIIKNQKISMRTKIKSIIIIFNGSYLLKK